ncbi:MAG: hypothetical protein JWM57_681 [Phycisphaerales bacterium]|nr:hypothetical protein [Phycisphaerales bacterium]
MSVGNDFVADRVADAAITGFAKMGLVKGGLAAVATTVGAGVATAVAMATPIALVAGVVYLCGGFDPPKKADK